MAKEIKFNSRIQRKAYSIIKDFPLFFFNATEEYDYSCRKILSYWESENTYFTKIPRIESDSQTEEIIFMFGYPLSSEGQTNQEHITLELTQFDANNPIHIRALLLLYLNKAFYSSGDYSLRELIWVFQNYFIDMDIISDVLMEFDAQSTQPFFWEAFKTIAPCLSPIKQYVIRKFLQSKGISISIYCPDMLVEAVTKCFPAIKPLQENLNIFRLINLAIVDDEYRNEECQYNYLQDNNISNFFLKLRRWLRDDDYSLVEYDKLVTFIRLFTPYTQLKIIKRYFYAVWKHQTQFDAEILRQFQNNKFENCSCYWHCTFEPSKPIGLAAQLLCDSVLTFLNSVNSGQYTLQTINGTLDLAYSKCDTNNPNIDFGLKHLVPLCNGGATPDKDKFQGFICYEIVHSLIDSKFTSEHIRNLAHSVFNKLGSNKLSCHIGDPHNSPDNQTNFHHFCKWCSDKQEIDEWIINDASWRQEYKSDISSILEILHLFVNKDFNPNGTIEISINEVITDTSAFKTKLINWLNKWNTPIPPSTCKTIDCGLLNLPQGWILNRSREWTSNQNLNDIYSQITDIFLGASSIIIEPRKDAFIGRGVLDNTTGLISDCTIDHYSSEIQKQENSVITPRIISAITELVKCNSNENGIFHVPYDVILRYKLEDVFYLPIYNSGSNNDNHPFLKHVTPSYNRYCAPKFEDITNFATQLTYFWCRGKECFKNSLENQTLEKCNSWEKYTILHILEILGYPQITETAGGNEASDLIRNFIGMVNKAASFFKRLRCRECNHILFPIKNSQFNRYNNFECHLPTCSQHRIRIYLNRCHHCKYGIIDSRDSKKCPNGWHICPNCLSCCNDNVYREMARKYELSNKPVPKNISEKLWQGHNDRGLFFCPKCGGEVKYIQDHTGRSMKICSVCNTNFDDNI